MLASLTGVPGTSIRVRYTEPAFSNDVPSDLDTINNVFKSPPPKTQTIAERFGDFDKF